jgi:hypothetical protein
MNKRNKILRIVLGIFVFCVALFFMYIAYLDSQSRTEDEFVIVPLFIGIIDIFITALILIENRFFVRISILFFSWLFGIISGISDLVLTVFFLCYAAYGNDFSWDWTMLFITGLLAMLQFSVCLIIFWRYKVWKSNFIK